MKILIINYNDNYIPMVPYMPKNPVPGYSYVPYQTNPIYFDSVYEGFIHGTMFPELVLPYTENMKRGVKR